jgi:alpha-beta hydrolase superfamily lysophospholipase
MEELITTANYLFSDGFQVVLFEGPGQGAALRKNNLYMAHRWEEPVSAVLDFFNLDDVVLIGISLGGYPALQGGKYIIIL